MKRPKSQLREGMWITAARVLAQLIQFGIFIVAVRVLKPVDFGVFALVSAVMVFLNQLATAGWSEYVLAWQGDIVRLRQTLFISLAAGAAIALLAIVISFPLQMLLAQPDAGPLSRVLSISMFFSAGASTYAGVLIWQHRLAASAIGQMLGELVNMAVAIAALMAGHGIMALAYGRLAGSVATCVYGIAVAKLAPSMGASASVSREILAFSWNITITRLLSALRAYGATLIIGGFMGPAAVGYYRAAQRVVGAFEEIVSEPVRVLSWTFFRKVPFSNGSVAEFGRAANRFFPILIYASVPLFVGIIMMAEDLTLGILGPEWLTAVPVMQLLSLAALIRAPGTASVPILSLIGKVAMLPRYVALYAGISLVCIAIGANFGLLATAMSEVIAAILVFMVSSWIMRRHADLHWSAIFRNSWPVLPALLALLAVPVIADYNALLAQLHPLVRFLCLGLAMIAVYLPTLILFDKSLWSRLTVPPPA